MAKLLVEFDTKDKVLAVSMDGKKLKNVYQVLFYNYGDNGSVEIQSSKMSEEDGTVTITKVYANDDGDDIVETEDKDLSVIALSKALFPHKEIE